MTFGLYPWQWLLLAALVVGAIVVATIMRRLIGAVAKWLLRKVHVDADAGLVKAVARGLALSIVAEADKFMLPFVGLDWKTTTTIAMWVDALAISFLVIAAYRFVDLVCLRTVDHVLRNRANGRSAAATLAPLIASALKVIVVVIGITIVLGLLGVNVAAILTGLSIGGVALALAAQDTIKNLFGSVMILADQPFAVGDWIIVQGAEGVVEEIGFRSTRIRTFADSLISIPNGRMADMTIDNLGLRRLRRYRTMVSIEHATSVQNTQAFVDAVRYVIVSHPLTIKEPDRISVALTELSTVGLTITVTMFADAAMLADEAMFKHEINMGILEAADARGIRLARQGEAPSSPLSVVNV
ncbi:MAG: mechanosensitive ion channel family protein [Ignavibacteria bacterium]|nr:mechanosensitive ion channel family protein [Ignavibacteria bacterium]MBP7093413.1 mechanosensitive ion channel family protein [Candidatus Kapabacteria bacterium]MBK6420124.1 mechanosensitive ion channel family protein [Ignavibacteria bacterium]MBK6759240.1 mechanosensitive ion channel family protein [Ignavibacteria bacterium]MBK7412933.1 mechanosensitive ion channel family protein [Ignavibacteria bacterium]